MCFRQSTHIWEHSCSADTTKITAATLDQKEHHPITSKQISRASLRMRRPYRNQNHTHRHSYPFSLHEGIKGSRSIYPPILNLGNRLRWVVDFTPRSLYPFVPLHAMKVYMGVEIQCHSFLTSALAGGECLALGPLPLLTGKDLLIIYLLNHSSVVRPLRALASITFRHRASSI